MNHLFLRADQTPTKAFRWLFLLSATALAGLLSVKGELVWVAASLPLVVLALIFLIFRFRFLERVFSSFHLGRAALSLVLSAYAAEVYANLFLVHLNRFAAESAKPLFVDLVSRYGAAGSALAGLVAVLALFVYLYWFFGWFSARMQTMLRTTDAVERWFFLVALALCVVGIVVVYSQTSVFSNPNAAADNVWKKVDILYTSDTSSLTEQNVFLNVAASENDIRQPLFGVFAAPFALGASLVSRLLHLPAAYLPLLQILQAALLLVSLVLVVRMLGFSGGVKALSLVLLGVLFPTLLFLLNMEQYIFSVFWLILLVWLFVSGETEGRDVSWIAATGSILISGVSIVLVPNSKSWKERFKTVALAVLWFALIALLFGRTAMVMTTAANLQFLLQFAGNKLPFLARLMQYVHFAASCFVAPAAQVFHYDSGMAVYHQLEVTGWSVGGFVVLAAAVAGFLLNRTSVFARICAAWVACSFLLLCVLGWGTSENGLVLYTLYFGWAFVSLILLLIDRLFRKIRPLQYGLLGAGILALAYANAVGLTDIIRFGLQYYPVS
jgi:hypothetical protein